MGEADDAAEWVCIVRDRYRWGSVLPEQVAEAEEIGVAGRESVQFLFEWLFFKGLLSYRFLEDPPSPALGP